MTERRFELPIVQEIVVVKDYETEDNFGYEQNWTPASSGGESQDVRGQLNYTPNETSPPNGELASLRTITVDTNIIPFPLANVVYLDDYR